jgi:hypothetical protein
VALKVLGNMSYQILESKECVDLFMYHYMTASVGLLNKVSLFVLQMHAVRRIIIIVQNKRVIVRAFFPSAKFVKPPRRRSIS